MSINNLLIWERHRPKSMDDIILLPRIRKNFENGLGGNYIFYGNYGSGKTSLARILIGKYQKDIPFLEINSSFDTSIEILRNDIENFCKFTPILDTKSEYKYIFLDEFDRISPEFQDALKAFMEKYSNIRIIGATNHINKISGGLKSRMIKMCFDAQNTEEEKYIKQEIFKKLVNNILPKENIIIDKQIVVSIIKSKFPDFRSIINTIDEYNKSKNIDNSHTIINNGNDINIEVYNLLYDKNASYEDIYHFLMSKIGADKIDLLISILGKSFVDWSINNNKSVDKLFECNYVIADYASKLESQTDPIILGMAIMGKIRDIVNK